MSISVKEEKVVRIKAEIKRLNASYTKIEPKTKKLIEGLIQEAAYMRITLQDHRKYLDDNDWVEPFSQSDKTEPYDRKRPKAEIYITMNKNYQSIMKQLTDLVPKEAPKIKDDGFDEFVNGRDDA